MIIINPGFESGSMNLEQETAFTVKQIEKNLEASKLQKIKTETELAELEFKYAGKEYSQEDSRKKSDKELLLRLLNEAIREAEEKLKG